VSGEYAVLYGARALAVPTRWGQYLEPRETNEEGLMHIRSFLNNEVWFYGTYKIPGFHETEASDERVSSFVKAVLLAADALKPGFFDPGKGYEVVSTLEFDPRWGLGSSSSLISNLAWWTGTDPYSLLWKVSPGSGYDIACARAEKSLVYQLKDGRPVVQEAGFDPPFKDKLFFVYLGKKQDSQYVVREFREKTMVDQNIVDEISGITGEICNCENLEKFSDLVTRHEECLSAFLKIPAVKRSRFPGYHGAMKSLGAWGGDMIMVTWEGEEEELRQYFESRGLKLIFRYDDLI
jgi:mevalonate kinase